MLREYEWQFLTQMISRIYCSESYEDLCATVFQQLHPQIPFDWGVCFQTQRHYDGSVLSHPVSSDAGRDFSAFLNGSYPRWTEFIMAPSSIIFQQSALIPADQWEKSRVYQEIWAPQDIYWGLFLSVVRRDEPLALFGFFRSKQETDFSKKDTFMLGVLQESLENRLYQLLHSRNASAIPNRDFLLRAAPYGLTSREIDVASLICQNMDTQSVCQRLCISPSTLNKHLASIFSKTHVKNRMQLFLLMHSES